MKRGLFIAFLAAILIIPAVSATITLSQPNNLYTFGDTLSVNVGINEQQSANDYLSVSAVCSGASLELYKAPLSVKAGQQKSVAIEALIDNSVFSTLQGDCTLQAAYNNEQVQTQTFRVDNGITVSLQTAGNIFSPGETIKITGTATRANGNTVSGAADISISNTDINSRVLVVNGSFSSNLSLPDNFASGGYNLNARVYDFDDSGNTLNRGNGTVQFRVKQVIRSAEIALSDVSIFPGNKTSFKIVLYDQSSMTASENAQIGLYSPSGKTAGQSVVSSGAYQSINTQQDYAPGYWTIVATIENVNTSKQFYVSEYSSAKTEIDNTTLIITNEGNVPYQNSLKINIGGTIQVIQLNVPVDGTQKLKLSAPDGSYSVEVSDGITNQTFGGVLLTGNAIGVSDLSSQSNIPWSNVFWIALIIVGLGVIIYYYRKLSKDRRISDIIPSLPGTARKRETEIRKIIQSSALTKSSRSGVRKEVTIVSLKIKNYDSLFKVKSPALETIAQAVKIAKDSKAVVTNAGASTTMYFSDSTIKEGNVILIAVKAAKEIENLIKSHNRKYAQKIDFGIGVNNDSFIVESSGGSWKFTSVGTGLSLAKKIADNASEMVLLSDSVHEKTRNEVKVDKDIAGLYWSVRTFTARSTEHEEFIKRFLSKNKFEGK